MSSATYGLIPGYDTSNQFRLKINFDAYPHRINWFIIKDDSPCYKEDGYYPYDGSIDCQAQSDYWLPNASGGPLDAEGIGLAQDIYS